MPSEVQGGLSVVTVEGCGSDLSSRELDARPATAPLGTSQHSTTLVSQPVIEVVGYYS